MKKQNHTLRTRLTALLLTLICVLGLFPTTAFAAADTIKLKDFGMSGVAYQSAALGRCTLHQMYYENGSATTVGFCGTKGGGMGNSLKGQTWGNKREITDATVKIMMAYFYAHANGKFTDEAHALGVDNIWGPEYCWYMNAWVQACIWRYQQGSISDPVVACAEEFMAVYNSLEGTHYTSIDDELDGKSFRDRTQFILDVGTQGVWGDCKVYEYTFTGSGSSAHPASSVQKVILGELEVTTITEDKYYLTVKKVDSTNPSKGLPGAKFHVQSENGAFSEDVVTGADGTYTIQNLEAGTYAVTETEAPAGYEIDNAGPQYVTLTDVTEGMYAFVEVSAPSPYAKLTEPVFAHVDQATINGGGTVTVTAADKKLPNLTILKRDAKTGDVIPDTHFEIKGIHYGYHHDVTTGPDGTATLTAIPSDSYEVTEISVPDARFPSG